MKYRVEWIKRKKKALYTARQHIVVYTLEDAKHIMDGLANDPAVTTIDVIPVFGE